MNVFNTIAVVLTVAVAGVGPFIAVHIGGKAFPDKVKSVPRHRAEDDDDNTMELPRVTTDPHHH